MRDTINSVCLNEKRRCWAESRRSRRRWVRYAGHSSREHPHTTGQRLRRCRRMWNAPPVPLKLDPGVPRYTAPGTPASNSISCWTVGKVMPLPPELPPMAIDRAIGRGIVRTPIRSRVLLSVDACWFVIFPFSPFLS